MTPVLPSHHADDIGARFADPSAFLVLISTTGVPRYRIDGSIVRWSIRPAAEGLSTSCIEVMLIL
jgi:hypothetical protein